MKATGQETRWRPLGRTAPIWLALALAGTSATSLATARAESRAADAIQPSSRDAADDDSSAKFQAVLERLTALGSQAVPAAARVLSGLAPTPEEKGLYDLGDLDDEQAGRVLALLEPFGRERVVDGIETYARTYPGNGTATGILRMLEHFGRSEELELVVRVTEDELRGRSASTSLDTMLRETVTSILERDPDGFDWMVKLTRHAPDEVAVTLALAVADVGSPRGLGTLAELLGWDAEFDQVALRQIGRLAESCAGPVEESVRDATRRLLSADEIPLVREAVVAAGRIEDFEAMESLVDLLEHPDPSVRKACVWSLSRLSGLSFAADPTRWHAWLGMERRWMLGTGPVLVAELSSPDAAVVIHALNELSRRRYRRGEVAGWILPTLQDHREKVRGLACTALGRLGAREALPSLVTALDDPVEEVAIEAWTALQAISGHSLPPDPQVWRVLCGSAAD